MARQHLIIWNETLERIDILRFRTKQTGKEFHLDGIFFFNSKRL